MPCHLMSRGSYVLIVFEKKGLFLLLTRHSYWSNMVFKPIIIIMKRRKQHGSNPRLYVSLLEQLHGTGKSNQTMNSISLTLLSTMFFLAYLVIPKLPLPISYMQLKLLSIEDP